MIVDVHTRVWESPDQLGTDAARYIRRRSAEPWAPLDASPVAHGEAMATVQCAFVLGFHSQLLEADIPSKFIADFVAEQPSKRVGFAGIDPLASNWRARFDEAKSLGLRGVVISPAAQGLHPTHSGAMSLYELCESAGMPVIIDQLIEWSPRSVMTFGQPWLLDEVARSFPDLPIVITNLGQPWMQQTLSLIGKHSRVFADVASVADRPWELYNALLAARQMGVLEKLLLGSGFPFSKPGDVITEIFSTNALPHGTHLPGIKREPLRALVERNAFTSLGVEPPPGVSDAKPDIASNFPAEHLPSGSGGTQETS